MNINFIVSFIKDSDFNYFFLVNDFYNVSAVKDPDKRKEVIKTIAKNIVKVSYGENAMNSIYRVAYSTNPTDDLSSYTNIPMD